MKQLLGMLAVALALLAPRMGRAQNPNVPAPDAREVARWERQARAVTITRDDWGIAHVHGRTDADAVFGMEYAQAEDDFNRVESNYIDALGRRAEADGESAIWRDLRMRLFIDPDTLRARYAASPAWLKQLMVAFADGLNFYLYRHPSVKPRVITRFEPWMALAFTEGSIGGDIESIDLAGLAEFYGVATPATSRTVGDGPAAEATTSPTMAPGDGDDAMPEATTSPTMAPGDGDDAMPEATTSPSSPSVPDAAGWPREPGGSNGIAIAPGNTRDHHALLWINPHTSFYFRSELQMSSDQGLDAYGAVTWGQFFVYQGFNRTAGWIHTSSGVDNIDQFLETVVRQGDRLEYRYGGRLLPVQAHTITIPFRTDAGTSRRTFTAYWTQHGPVVRRMGERWVTVSLMQSPVNALIQSYTRTRARDYAAFRRIMELHTNSSNNTVFADAEGHIAYFHSNYIPRRDTAFDWTRPVDGSDPATAYHGLLSLAETPGVLDPPVGWLYNSNNWPWSAAGPDSPRRHDFPRYVERGTEESPRGYHALRLLTGARAWTMSSLTAAAFDSYLPAFATMIPRLLQAYDSAARTMNLKPIVEQAALLRGWDYRWGVGSVPTSLAVFWGTELQRRMPPEARRAGLSLQDWVVQQASAAELLQALADASDRLAADFGKWRTPWGDINRFQRLDDAIDGHFDDSRPSIPVPFTSSAWGSLASFGARSYANTRKWYGTSGNSFVAVVEFGDSVRARAVTAGGESGNPASPHFDDEAERYTGGNLRTVYFYPGQLIGHTERRYHPGD